MRRNAKLVVPALVAAAAAVLVGYAVAQDRPPHPPPPPRPPVIHPADDSGRSELAREVHKRLRRTIPKLEFDGIAFSDVIQFLREQSGINIFVKWEVLKRVNINKKSPVNVKLTNVTVGKVLRTILDDVGSVNPLGFAVDENVITISTPVDLHRARQTAMQERVMAAEAAFPRKQAEHMEHMFRLIQRMKHVCFDSEAVGVMAVGALKDEVRRKPEDIIRDLEARLTMTKTLGLRNAIRLTLKDIYKRQGNDKKVLEHIRAMLTENDKALQAAEKKPD